MKTAVQKKSPLERRIGEEATMMQDLSLAVRIIETVSLDGRKVPEPMTQPSADRICTDEKLPWLQFEGASKMVSSRGPGPRGGAEEGKMSESWPLRSRQPDT